jgi:diguanylate cyclase (GGDEF)-like protein/PAS domain S-box-containing protein
MQNSLAVPSLQTGHRDDAEMFELAPMSLWLEDYGGVKRLFDAWRADGVTSLREHLLADPARVRQCTEQLKIIKVNPATLRLFEADDLPHLIANLGRVFRDDMFTTFVGELVQLWDGKPMVSNAVNYTLSGKRLDIQLKGAVLPGYEDTWERMLIAIEDVTERETARRHHAASEVYARGLFEHSPVSLWVEDFSSIKSLLDEMRLRGISNFRTFTDVHPEFVTRCMSEIRVIDVNRHTLDLFGAPDKDTLLRRISDVFRDDMQSHFREQLIELWDGKLFQQREVVNYTLDGTELHLHLQFSVLPGCEHDWSLVQIALTDITARKKAEAYLEYLGKHDVLTKLRNRAYFEDELNRLERRGPWPVTVIAIDLNRLKEINDRSGHAAGDAVLRRAGEVLGKVGDRPVCAARIGGDEFVLLMPASDERAGQSMIERVQSLIDLNNSYYPGAVLSLAMGSATAQRGDRLEAVVSLADERMMVAKREFYATSGHDRRSTRPTPLGAT